jgi:hypothetical protein
MAEETPRARRIGKHRAELRERAVEVPYTTDPHAFALIEFLECVRAQANGEAPQWIRGVPQDDWSRAGSEPLPGVVGVTHAVEVLSGAGAREAEIAIVFKRILRRVSPIVQEEVERYLHGDEDAATFGAEGTR